MLTTRWSDRYPKAGESAFRTNAKATAIMFLLLVIGAHGAAHNLYDILGIDRSSGQSEIKKAYRNLTLQWHPDRAKDKDEATQKFQEINTAYNVLSVPKTRKYYNFYGDSYKHMEEYYEEVIERYGIPELYAFKKNVHILFDKNVDELLSNSPYMWIVTFYHPNCGSCQRSVPLVTALADHVASGDRFRVGVMNCGATGHLCNRFNIEHYGKIYFFPKGQERSGFWEQHSYDGPLTKNSILLAAQNVPISEVVGVKNEGEILSRLKRTQTTSYSRASLEAVWLVEYYKPTCSHCHQLKSELRLLSATLKGVVKVAEVDCSKSHCDVPFYPYIRLMVRRRGTRDIERFDLDYSNNGHPGGLAIKIVGLILREAVGLHWSEKSDSNSENEARRGNDEL